MERMEQALKCLKLEETIGVETIGIIAKHYGVDEVDLKKRFENESK